MLHWSTSAGDPWAITEPVLNALVATMDATMENHTESIEAISAKLGNPLDNTFVSDIRDGVAIVPVVGPLFRYANFFTFFMGASSYEILAKDFTSALNNPDVKAIVLNIDSPGGEVNGCAEFANLIFEARGKKPIVAYASGDAASGAYWVASACDEIVVSETSVLGSIGVVALYRNKKQDYGEGSLSRTEIVSSQSPYKRLDPEKSDDKSRLQTRIDGLAEVFIEAVARHRGVDPPRVKKDYGRGDVLIGKQAVTQGLADSVGSLEKIIQQFQPTINDNPKNPANERGSSFLASTNLEEKPIAMKTRDIKPDTDTEIKPKHSEQPTNDEGKTPSMSKALDVETLKANYPQLVARLLEDSKAGATEGGLAEGKQKERERIGAIIAAEEAKGREQLAQHLAFSTDLSAEMVLQTLAASPKKMEEPSPSSSIGFEKVMGALDNPAIDADGDNDSEESIDDITQRIASFSNGGAK